MQILILLVLSLSIFNGTLFCKLPQLQLLVLLMISRVSCSLSSDHIKPTVWPFGESFLCNSQFCHSGIKFFTNPKSFSLWCLVKAKGNVFIGTILGQKHNQCVHLMLPRSRGIHVSPPSPLEIANGPQKSRASKTHIDLFCFKKRLQRLQSICSIYVLRKIHCTGIEKRSLKEV